MRMHCDNASPSVAPQPEGVIAAIIALRPSDAHFASDHVIDTPKSLTSRFGASARRSRTGRSSGFHAIAATARQQDPKQPITTTETRAISIRHLLAVAAEPKIGTRNKPKNLN